MPRRFLSSFYFVLVAFCAFAQPRGHLVIIGGGERGDELMKTIVQLAGGERAKMIVFTMATGYPQEVGAELMAEIKQLGVTDVRAMHLKREHADMDSVLQLLRGVTGIYFSGGDQSRVTAALKGSKVETRLHELYQNGAVIGGTSAGAAIMSEVMITGDQRRPVGDSSFNKIEAENVITTPGLGFVKTAIIDQHFVRRRRMNRLLSVVFEHPQLVGIGIDEGTAIWVKPDQTFEVLGVSAVLVIDATHAHVQRDSEPYALQASDARLHILRRGAIYDLRNRKVKRLQTTKQ